MRKCRCGAEIINCNGFVKAVDFLEFIEGKRKKEDVRELCGRCILPTFFMNPRGICSFMRKIGWLTP